MSEELKTIKFQLMLSPSEAEKIDDWGFKNRIRTRAEAIRRLCQIGIMFDENRMHLMRRGIAATDSFSELTKILSYRKNDNSDLSEFERELLQAYVESMFLTLKLTGELRFIVGIARNYKEDKNILEIMKEAQEILDITFPEFEEFKKQLPEEKDK